MNSFAFSSCPIYKSYIGQTNRKRNKSALLVWAILVYLLGPEPRAALDHATPLYTALGDTVNKEESITSVRSCEKPSNSAQNYGKATDIRTNATDVETRINIVQ